MCFGESSGLSATTRRCPEGLTLARAKGTTRPTLNQILKGLEDAGLIELGRGRTIVKDPAALAARVR